jgi:dTDP-L-rhamnose 4-epimerase
VASIFRSALEAGRNPEVYEDGCQTRDFVHVTDVARANVLALTAPDAVPGAYNVASGTPHTVADLARAIGASINPRLQPVVTGGWRRGDVRHVVASPHRAAESLGFVAAVGFDDGMAELARAHPPAGH